MILKWTPSRICSTGGGGFKTNQSVMTSSIWTVITFPHSCQPVKSNGKLTANSQNDLETDSSPKDTTGKLP